MIKKCVFIALTFLLMVFPNGLSATKKVICWGSATSPVTMDPAQAWDETSVFFAANIFETLVRLNPDTLEIEPSLAVSWETKNQGKTWIFKLRKNIKFHDGTDFDAGAVVFSFQRQLNKNFKFRYFDFIPFKEIFRNIKSVSEVDPYTVVFYLHNPYYPFLSILSSSGASIISPTAAKKFKANFSKKPVGTGPFMLKSWKDEERIILLVNPQYWNGKAGFDELVFMRISNYDQLHKRFRQGELDIIDSISISRTLGLKNVKWVTISRTPLLALNFIVFNFKNKYLQNEHIRRAIKYAWDDRVLKYIYQDFVVSLNSVIPRGIPGYQEILKKKEFSVPISRDILARENITEKMKLVFLLRNDSTLDRQLVQLYSRNLSRVGIQVDIQVVSDEEYVKRVKENRFDLTISGWIADYPDSYNILSALFDPQFQEGGFANLSGYRDDKLREYINQIANESNAWIRKNMIERTVRKIDEKALCIPIWQNTFVLIYNNKRIEKMSVSPYGTIELFNIIRK